jgi:hypothetical protein
MTRIRSGDDPPPRPHRSREQVAQLRVDGVGSRHKQLSMEEIAALYGITLIEANKLMTEYERLYPGSRRRRVVLYLDFDSSARRGDA